MQVHARSHTSMPTNKCLISIACWQVS